jgi:hypothetical protein
LVKSFVKGQIEPPKNPDALALRSVEFSRILLIKPSALGDVVHTLPVLVKLRARYPRARIDWLITPENAEVVRYHPALSNVVLFARRDFSKRGRRWRAFVSFFDLLKQIRSAKYELIIDMHGQVRSAFFALISGARVRIGFDRPVKRGLTVSAEHDLKNIPNHGWRGAREGSWIAYTHRIPFRRSMFTRSIVTFGSRRCLASMIIRPISLFTFRRRLPAR